MILGFLFPANQLYKSCVASPPALLLRRLLEPKELDCCTGVRGPHLWEVLNVHF